MNRTRPKVSRARYRGSSWRGWSAPSNTPFETAGTRTLESDRALNAPLAARAVAWRARALLLGVTPSPPFDSRGQAEGKARERERVNNSFELNVVGPSSDRWRFVGIC